MKTPKMNWLVVVVPLWVITIGVGMKALADYQFTPGQRAQAREDWPAHIALQRATGVPTLVMFAHPLCPCTRASLGELARIVAQCNGKLTVRVVFLKLEGVSAMSSRSDLWKTAVATPGVQVTQDEAGTLAHAFGAKTSGQVMLYNRDGRLIFSGGITDSRSHEGDNDGSDAIISFVATGRLPQRTTPVFGCSIISSTQTSAAKNP